MGQNTRPLVSVITACLNAEEFLVETIESVLGQSYPHMEYIIIDGGSTDGTVEIIKRYANKLAYWHSQPDRGLAHAFNLGLSKAQGKWVLFLNADDYLFNSYVIENMVPYFKQNGDADVIFGQIAWASRQHEDYIKSFSIRGRPWRWRTFRFVCTIPHQSAFTRRKYFEAVGYFNEDLRIAMDYEIFLRRGPRLRAVFVPQIISLMRSGGVSSNVIATLKEWRKAQILTRATPNWLIWGNYLARFIWNMRGQDT